MNHMSRNNLFSSQARAAPVPELDDEQKHDIRTAFQLFDTDGDGQIGFYELKAAMRALGFDVPKPEVLKILKENDKNGRRLSADAFFNIMSMRIANADPNDELKRAFELFDVNGRGKIGFTELKQAAQEIGESISDEELRAMIEVFDLNGDGDIELDEFIAICEGVTK